MGNSIFYPSQVCEYQRDNTKTYLVLTDEAASDFLHEDLEQHTSDQLKEKETGTKSVHDCLKSLLDSQLQQKCNTVH